MWVVLIGEQLRRDQPCESLVRDRRAGHPVGASERVRELGYGCDLGEEIKGVNCVGAPVFDAHGYPAASIWITGPSDRVGGDQIDIVGKSVRAYADMISARLGYGLI